MKNPESDNLQDIDAIFKNHFAPATEIIEQPNVLWEAIENRRRKRSKRYVLFWLTGFLVLGGLLGAYFWKASEVTPAASSLSVPPPQKIADNKSDQAKVEQLPIITEKENNSGTNPVPPNAIHPATSKEAITTKKVVVSKVVVSKKEKNTLHPKTDFSPASVAVVQTPAKQISSFNYQQNLADIQSLNPSVTRLSESETVSLKHLMVSVTDDNTDKTPNPGLDNCWEPRSAGNFFINMYAQAGSPFESISSQDNSENNDYQSRWEERMSPFLSYEGGLQLGYHFPWSGYVSTGVHYQNFQTKYESSQRVTERITIFDEMAYFYFNDVGERVWVADSVTVTNIIDRNIRKRNTHELWHIPLQLGYLQQKDEGFRFGINAEALFNISKQYEGSFYTENAETLEIDTRQDNGYMSTDIGVSFSTGLHLGYMLNEQLEIYAQPRFRFNQNSYLAPEQNLSISRHFAGIRAGLQYQF